MDQIQVIETYKPKTHKNTKKKFKRIGQMDTAGDAKKGTTNAPPPKKRAPESLDFHDCESMMYRKHETRRFFQDRGHFWNKSRTITFWKWAYVVFVGIIVGCIGSFITTLINALLDWKFTTGLVILLSPL